MEGFRVIPGYEKWCVTANGKIYEAATGKLVRAHKYGDRLFCSYKNEGVSNLIGVHTAVALAWVPNDDPVMNIVVNHKDGDPMNNWYKNLEWTTYSGNNYHAVNTGLRKDCIPCRIRNFYTKEVKEFPSIAQASEYMGLSKTSVINTLRSQKFGKLIAGQYEFRLEGDPEPFFYENRDFIISPSRYMVMVEEPDGSVRYVFNTRDMLRRYQLYACPYGRSVPALVQYAREKYPDKKFTLRDGYSEMRYVHEKETSGNGSRKMPVMAMKDGQSLEFESLTSAAKHFQVDRDVIKLRLSNPESTYLGWTFNGKPCFRET